MQLPLVHDRPRMRTKLAVAVMVVLAVAIPPAAAQSYGAAIWNGSASAEGANAAVAALQRPNSTAPVDCSGTLVHPRWVLTAAHCVYDVPAAPVTLGVDGTDVRSGFSEVFTTRLHVVHPLWNPRTVRFDVALLRLPAASRVAPMPLATTDEPTAAGTEAQIVGWGASDGDDRGGGRLREALISLAHDDECAHAHANYDPRSMLCGSGVDADACRGDSGGPLFSLAHDQRVLLGVTSFGDDCGTSAVGVYARVPAVRAWIDEVIAGRRVPAFATDAGLIPSADHIRAGRRVTLRAALVRYSDGAPLLGQRVEILRRPRGTTRWRVAARRTTDVEGMVTYRDEPRRHMQYALRHRGTAATKPSMSPPRTVRVVR